MLRGTAGAGHQLSVAEEHGDAFGNGLDRLERILAGKEAELQRLKTELALKTLYVEELQATLDSQARELEAFDGRLRHMESRVSRNLPQQPPPEVPACSTGRETTKAGKAVPLLIRIRRGMRD